MSEPMKRFALTEGLTLEAGWNSSFSMEIPTLQVAWDSTSLGALKECARKYFYRHICGWQGRTLSVHLTFGLLYHGALERYDHARFSGDSHDTATCLAVRYCMEQTWDRERNRPIIMDDKNKNRYTLVRTVIWYLEQFADDPCETIRLANGKPAVEVSFRFNMGGKFITGEDIIYCGHLDRMVSFQGSDYILDRKTTKSTLDQSYFDKFSPDNQFSGYCVGASITWGKPVSGLIVDAAQVAVTFSRFQRAPVTRSEDQLQEWYRDAFYWISQAENFAKIGYWPMNDKSCGNYGGCDFRGICSKSERVRPEWLQAQFVKRIWDPLQTRGDI